MRQIWTAMINKQLESLVVGKVAFAALDALFKVVRIPSITKHYFVVIGFQEHCIAPAEAVYYVFARYSDVRENTYVG
jgi:hypothetical protein